VLIAASFALAWPARGLVRDVWQNRLNAAFPGGQWLTFGGDRGAYRFSSGEEVFIESGFAAPRPASTGRRAAHLLALAHPSPRSALLLTDWPAARDSLKLHVQEIAEPSGDPRRSVRACVAGHDLLLASPSRASRLRRLATRGFLKEVKACLKPGGVAGLLADEELVPELAAAAQGVFARAEMAGPLLLLSESPLAFARPFPAVLLDDPALPESLTLSPPPVAAALRTDDRPYGPSVTSRNLYNSRR
jgi:hypothetical protein